MLFSFIFTSILCCTLLWLSTSLIFWSYLYQLWECVEATSGHLHQLLLVTTCTTPQSLHFHSITYCKAVNLLDLWIILVDTLVTDFRSPASISVGIISLTTRLAFSDELIFLIVNLICITNHNSLSLSLLEFTCLLL